MSSQDDWCIKLEAQQAIQRFATLTWNISHLKSLLARHTSELEAIEDAQGEFDLKDSWVRIGESFDLINADTETGVMNQFEKRHEELEAEIAVLKTHIAKEEAEADVTKKTIAATLGERVQLNM